MKIFSGSASRQLTDKICKQLSCSPGLSDIVRFNNSELKVTVNQDVYNQDCVVIQSTSNPTDSNLMELFFFADALHRGEAKRLIAVIPYFGYARQDAQHKPGECISVNVIIRFLETVGYDKVICINLHDQATEGVFSISLSNLSAVEILSERIKKIIGTANPPASDFSVISPDQGGIERAREFAEYFFGKDQTFTLGATEKKRNLDAAHQSEALDLYADVENKTVIIVDDIITSGRTLFNAAQLCQNRGSVKVYAAIVHNELNAQSIQSLDKSSIVKLITTDSIENSAKGTKIETISVDSLLADNLRKYLHP